MMRLAARKVKNPVPGTPRWRPIPSACRGGTCAGPGQRLAPRHRPPRAPVEGRAPCWCVRAPLRRSTSSRPAVPRHESAPNSELRPRFASAAAFVTVDFRRQSLNGAIDQTDWMLSRRVRCRNGRRRGRYASCHGARARSGMKFAIPYIRSGLEKRTVVPPCLMSQATVNRRQYKIQCGLNAFEVSKIKGNPQTPENRITL